MSSPDIPAPTVSTATRVKTIVILMAAAVALIAACRFVVPLIVGPWSIEGAYDRPNASIWSLAIDWTFRPDGTGELMIAQEGAAMSHYRFTYAYSSTWPWLHHRGGDEWLPSAHVLTLRDVTSVDGRESPIAPTFFEAEPGGTVELAVVESSGALWLIDGDRWSAPLKRK
jgi:hypothetical protein